MSPGWLAEVDEVAQDIQQTLATLKANRRVEVENREDI